VDGKIATRNLEDKDDLIAHYQYAIIEQKHKIANQEHDIWHLTDAEFAFKGEYDRIFQEMIDIGYYVEDYSFGENSGNISAFIRSYKRVTLEPQIVYVTQNITIEVPLVLSDWNSIEELKTFLTNDTSDSHVYLTIDNSVTSFNGICEHRAFKLRDNALEIGKRLDTEILTKEECFKYQEYLGFSTQILNELPDINGHYIVKAIVGNEIWFIEPSNDNVWLGYYLD